MLLPCTAMTTVEPVYYGHLGIDQKYPDYQDVLLGLRNSGYIAISINIV